MCDRASCMKMTRGTNLMQQFCFIIINISAVGYKLTHSTQDYTPAPQDLSHNT